ncbi:MAG: cation:proton antiporter [Anaerolineaceae bacterium]|nr:cation:proton antiporter [Anaerolineaceae bacterium]
MPHSDLILFFVQLAAMLGCAMLFGHMARKLHQPAVLGELVGGIVLGPSILGGVFPQIYNGLFPPSDTLAVAQDGLIKLGMLFFMFVAGLEINLRQVRQQGQQATLISVLGIAVPLGLGLGLVVTWPEVWGDVVQERLWLFALFLGAALSISALPVITRILVDLRLLDSPLGTLVMVAATVNDLIGWALFAVVLSYLVPNHTPPELLLGQVVAFSLLTLVLSYWIGLHVMAWLHDHLAWPGGFIGVAAVLVLVAAALAELFGLHAFFGAFLVGVGLGQGTKRSYEAYQTIHHFAVNFLAPIYFVSIGLRADFVSHFDLRLVAIVTLAACLGKIGGASLGARLAGMTPRDALTVGFALNARGAMEIILASIALDHDLIDQRIFVAMVIMALATSMISGPAIRQVQGKNAPLTASEQVLP